MQRPEMLCEAVRGDERVVGCVPAVAERIGLNKGSVYSAIREGYTLFGWRIRRIGSIESRVQYAAYHVSDTARQDPVTGDAEEIAEVLGISCATYIAALVHTGRVTKTGYIVERCPEEEQWQTLKEAVPTAGR